MTNGESVAKSRILPVFPLLSVGVTSDRIAILTPIDSLKARSPSISESAALADNRYLERAGGSECYAEIELT
ncbi:hypothetical protein QR685DRAFT_570036 [Neurospora intermedia]|uniref:Uncharacterized protein n=1 Tax=Neurospora intermedia TaxID=5142 RepID=A0ABR3DN28_NEUIN